MKRLLIVATLALSVLAGAQSPVKAQCCNNGGGQSSVGFGIGIGLNLDFTIKKSCANPCGQGNCNPCYGMGGGMPYGMCQGMCGYPGMMGGGMNPMAMNPMMGMNPMAMNQMGMNPMMAMAMMAPGYGGYPMMGMSPAFGGGFNPALASMMGMGGMGMGGMGMGGMGMGMDPTMLAMSGFGGMNGFGGMPGFGGMNSFGGMPGGLAGLNGLGGMSPFGNGMSFGQPILVSIDYGNNNQTTTSAKPATAAAEAPASPGVIAAAQ